MIDWKSVPTRSGVAAVFAAVFACLSPVPTAQADSVTHVANVALATDHPFSYIDQAEGVYDDDCASAGGYIDGGAPTIKLVDFGFAIPSTAEITHIAVYAKSATMGSDRGTGLKVRLRRGELSHGYWYYITVKGSGSANSVACSQSAVNTMSRADWGIPFTPTEVNDETFAVELLANVNGNSLLLDGVQVTVKYDFPDRIFADGFDAP